MPGVLKYTAKSNIPGKQDWGLFKFSRMMFTQSPTEINKKELTKTTNLYRQANGQK